VYQILSYSVNEISHPMNIYLIYTNASRLTECYNGSGKNHVKIMLIFLACTVHASELFCFSTDFAFSSLEGQYHQTLQLVVTPLAPGGIWKPFTILM
jgi:hypothetical protein